MAQNDVNANSKTRQSRAPAAPQTIMVSIYARCLHFRRRWVFPWAGWQRLEQTARVARQLWVVRRYVLAANVGGPVGRAELKK